VDPQLRLKNQLRHKTGVTRPGEFLNSIQHSPQLHSDQEPFLDRLETANLQFPTRPINIPTIPLANLPQFIPQRVPPKSSTCDNIKYNVKIQNKLQCDIPPKH